ncbi:GGDEF domain-containing protein, partial [Legionella sp. S2E2]|uniref:GGDEF domain-containing protein n=1 Tax=Legionella sp. S2E2 TaxID=3402815 RepID=UPI003AF76DD6
GDEFCVFCSGLNQKDVSGIIQRLKDSLKSATTTDYTIQISVGVIQYDPKQHQTLGDIMDLADSEMYVSKRGNSNRRESL